jgi:hypothetical protein
MRIAVLYYLTYQREAGNSKNPGLHLFLRYVERKSD